MAVDTVVWINQNRPSVTIEIRKGNDSTPTNNPVVAIPTLQRNGSHTETSEGVDFYYVRTNPPSDGIYIHRPCYGNGERYEEHI
jgi:hypothetical protein